MAEEDSFQACSGVLALRRVTSLLSAARRADAQGQHQKARDLYAEVLKAQQGLARAPLGSIGKSLKEVTATVEARLQHLNQVLGEEGSSSRPATSGSTAIPGSVNGLSSSGVWPQEGEEEDQRVVPWDMAGPLFECPVSARDTNVTGRPGTQEGSSRRTAAEGWRPTTRDGLTSRQSSLDGLRPSTRDGQRLQQMIDGGGAHHGQSSRGHSSGGHSSRGHSSGGRGGSSAFAQGAMGGGGGCVAPITSTTGGSGTGRESRDSARPPTSGGLGSSRGQDVSIRQVTGRRRGRGEREQRRDPQAEANRSGFDKPMSFESATSEQHTADVLSLDSIGTLPGGVYHGFDPPMDTADECVELLE